MKRVPLLSVVLALVAPIAVAQERIDCAGQYGGHLQGVVTDSADGNPTAIFWSFTVALVKTDLKGQLIKAIDVPTHHGDLACHEGKVYVAVNLKLFNEEPGKADSWIYVYDANDLTLLTKHAVPEVVHGAGGVEFHNGHFFVVGGLPVGYTENYVYEYDADFKFVKRHVVASGYTDKGIQTVSFFNGAWWFGCYGKPEELLKADENFGSLAKYQEDWALGIAPFTKGTCIRGVHKRDENKKLWTGAVLVESNCTPLMPAQAAPEK
ncbi:MAG: hypothetical protein K1Y02_23520 [Candidatus Hydrogenedentes bacterium]|nr:hypothetical protein [Candidatus Hydrogenedentota bacterium]